MHYLCNSTSDHQLIEIVYWLLSSSMVCAKGDRGVDLCTGDFGNALVCSGRLTGVAILSNTCGNGRDTAYTKITASSVRSFIRSQTGV